MFNTYVDVVRITFEIIVDVPVDTKISISEMVQGKRNVGAGKAPLFPSVPKLDLLEVLVEGRRLDRIMVPDNQSFLAVEPSKKFSQLLVVSAKSTSYITEMVDVVARHHDFIPLVDHELIHELRILERTFAKTNDVFMKKVRVTDKPFLGHVISLSRSRAPLR